MPLCGKSQDMNLIVEQGYRVMGVELSRIAIHGYFDACKLTPQRIKKGRFSVWEAGNIEIWCGDIFDLKAKELSHIRTMYDCTSLTAFAPQARPRYVRHFFDKLARQSQIMLMTTESPDESCTRSELTIDSEVQALYQNNYEIRLLHGQNSLAVDPEYPEAPMSMMDEKVYLMKTLTG